MFLSFGAGNKMSIENIAILSDNKIKEHTKCTSRNNEHYIFSKGHNTGFSHRTNNYPVVFIF